MLLAGWLLAAGGCVQRGSNRENLDAVKPPGPIVANLAFPLSGGNPTPLALTRVFAGVTITSPVFVTSSRDGSDRVFVVEHGGRIKVLANDPATTRASVFLDLRSQVLTGGEQGLLGLAFAPDYPTSGAFFVCYSTRLNGNTFSRVSQFTVSTTNPNLADPASERVLLTVPQPFSNHNGGMIAFGPDRMLYIGLGDGGSASDPLNNSQNTSNLLGSMLRIDPFSSTGGLPYGIPADNPFVGVPGYREETWAYGLRNPWRWSFDRVTGELWLGDVGQEAIEEVDIIVRGGNYGWRIKEGTRNHIPVSNPPPLIDPIHEYDHSVGVSVTGGFVYRGSRIPSLRGSYVYGDYNGAVFALSRDSAGVVTNQRVATGHQIASLGEDEAGELFVVSHGHAIYRVDSASGPQQLFPQLLSQTGLFADVATLTPAPGVVPYDVNVSSWKDGARSKRWIAASGIASFSANGAWDLPLGSVTVKHFEIDLTETEGKGHERRLETRVFVHEQTGWAGYTYRWNPDGSDASLLPDSGFTETIPGTPSPYTYAHPSRNACLRCHNGSTGSRLLGIRTDQLNRLVARNGRVVEQLTWLQQQGILSPRIPAPNTLPQLPPQNPFGANIPDQARAYLHTNCAICHRPGGPTPVAINLDYTTPLANTLTIGFNPLAGDLGIPNAKIITPRMRQRSILWERMRRQDNTRMPKVGSIHADPVGLELIGLWIDSL